MRKCIHPSQVRGHLAVSTDLYWPKKLAAEHHQARRTPLLMVSQTLSVSSITCHPTYRRKSLPPMTQRWKFHRFWQVSVRSQQRARRSFGAYFSNANAHPGQESSPPPLPPNHGANTTHPPLPRCTGNWALFPSPIERTKGPGTVFAMNSSQVPNTTANMAAVMEVWRVSSNLRFYQ